MTEEEIRLKAYFENVTDAELSDPGQPVQLAPDSRKKCRALLDQWQREKENRD